MIDYTIETLHLAHNEVATLISLPAEQPRGAVLYVHGFVDYFFHDHVAQHFVAHGWSWHALDLRRNGRSLRDGDERFYSGDLQEYYEEIDAAIARIKSDGYERIVLMGHSTGGLVSVIWANDRRESHPIDALILNSPWLDLQEPWIMRTLGTWILRGIGAVKPLANLPQSLESVNTQSVHKDARGEWDFDTAWKPLTATPVKVGFIATVRREQARLHRGMDVGVPVLLLRSARSQLKMKAWDESARSADTVLNVKHMHQWLPKVGRDTTEIVLDSALHDVMLSAEPVRNRAMAEVDAWLDERFPR
ncbi:MAG: alpha/beta hydrolase [Thermomicrobiales bacterium]|nr:alpha/beta hydrolase [Thermomicrobiales bacterium]